MGPLVDVALVAVAPVLEELGRGARVIDLVEVHGQRLPEPERAQHERGHDQHHEQPQVELVEATASLVGKRGAPVGHDGPLVEPLAEPQAQRALAEDRARAPHRRRLLRLGFVRPGRIRGPIHDRGAGDRGAGERRAGRDGFRGRLRDGQELLLALVDDAGLGELVGQPFAAVGAQLDERPDQPEQVDHRDDRDPQLVVDRPADPEPVADPEAAVVVDRGEDDVHVQERRDRQRDVRHAPADRHRGEDRGKGVEREQVAFVDARRHDEEHEREHGERHEQRASVRMARGDDHDQHDGREQQRAPHGDRRQRADERGAGAAAVAAAGVRTDARRVAHPQPVVGEGQAAVAGDERPGVVGVDGDVRVASRRPPDLLEEPGAHEWRLRGQLHHRQVERGREDDRRDQARRGPLSGSGSDGRSRVPRPGTARGGPLAARWGPAADRRRTRRPATAPGGS